jgi:hypothetical protein
VRSALADPRATFRPGTPCNAAARLLASLAALLMCPQARCEADAPEQSAVTEGPAVTEVAEAVPDETSGEPDEAKGASLPCPELGLEGERPMLERFRDGVEHSVCVSAWRFDRMFGVLPEDQVVEGRVAHGRLRTGLEWDERRGFGEELTLRAQVQLPIAERRMRAVFGRDTDEAFIEGGSREFDGSSFADEEDDRSWLLGLGYEPIRGTRSRLSLGAGVRLRSPPDPYVQASYWYTQRINDDLLMRARQTVFWENEDGFGTATRLAFERILQGQRMLRWSNYARISEVTDGVRWNTSLTLYQAFSQARAIALRGAVRGETGREVNPVEYKLVLIHRRSFLRDWLFLEVRGGGGWVRTEQEEPREFVPEAAVVLEMSFGRHPRLREAAAATAPVEP